jgi:hypothetical protein
MKYGFDLQNFKQNIHLMTLSLYDDLSMWSNAHHSFTLPSYAIVHLYVLM